MPSKQIQLIWKGENDRLHKLKGDVASVMIAYHAVGHVPNMKGAEVFEEKNGALVPFRWWNKVVQKDLSDDDYI